MRVLFLGRSDCESSDKLINRLIDGGAQVTSVKSKKRGEDLPQDALSWVGDYIISYRSFFVLPEGLLNRARVAAINFHPGPPEYPGTGCANFALYNNESEYGVTAHVMSREIDSGPILEVRRFPVCASDDISSLLAKTHELLAKLCSDFIDEMLAKNDSIITNKVLACKDERWSGKARLLKHLDDLQIILPDITKDELMRIIRATYLEEFPPRIRLHGFDFYLKL